MSWGHVIRISVYVKGDRSADPELIPKVQAVGKEAEKVFGDAAFVGAAIGIVNEEPMDSSAT